MCEKDEMGKKLYILYGVLMCLLLFVMGLGYVLAHYGILKIEKPHAKNSLCTNNP